jgi:nicotinamide mononucleotide transporter
LEQLINNKFYISGIVALVATIISYIVAFYAGWVTEPNWLEIFAVFTSYASTYLCVVQSRWNYPIGVITTIAYSILFYQLGLFASALTNIYLPLALIYGWWRWGPDGNTRPVTHLKFDLNLLWYPIVVALSYGLVYVGLIVTGATLPGMDSLILVLTILAQFLLDNKKIETWIIWAIMNVIAIYVYFNSGLYLAAFQYVFFLANTVYGWYMWNNSINKEFANV